MSKKGRADYPAVEVTGPGADRTRISGFGAVCTIRYPIEIQQIVNSRRVVSSDELVWTVRILHPEES